MKKSVSFPSALQTIHEKSDRHRKRGSLTDTAPLLPEYQPASNSSGESLGSREPDDDALVVSGDSQELRLGAADGQSAATNDIGGEIFVYAETRVWNWITGSATCPIEENSENGFIDRCQRLLEKEREKLEEQALKNEQKAQEVSLKQNQEIQWLKEAYDKSIAERDTLKSKLANKEKKCYQLHREIDKKIKADRNLDATQVVELELRNVKIALTFCSTILDSNGARQYALKKILKLAKEWKQVRPHTA